MTEEEEKEEKTIQAPVPVLAEEEQTTAPEKKPKEAEKKGADISQLSDTARKIMEMVEKMTVVELSGLVKVLEEKFGVSAAAPVVAAAPATVEAAEEKSTYTINLVEAGANKINVIKALRAVIEIGLKEAKDLVEGAPKIVKENVKKEEAETMKKKLEEAGAKVELV